MTEHFQIELEDFKRFLPFQNLDDHQLLLLAKHVEYRRVPADYRLFDYGDIDSDEFFLLSGKVQLASEDGKQRQVDDKDDAAKRQIARLRPRQYTVSMVDEGTLLVIDADVLEELQEGIDNTESTQDHYCVDEVSSVEELESRELFTQFQVVLRKNKLVLPSLPEVAMEIRKLLDSEGSDAESIAHMVNSDPAIAAKLIRAANSPLYHGTSTCETTRNAIVRLGLQTTRQLVVSFAIRDLFQTTSPQLKKRMQLAWQHSTEVAAISFVIARMVKSFNYPAEEVLLAGLLHNIGVIAILGFLEMQSSPAQDEAVVDALLCQWQGKAGEAILTQWKFSYAFIKVALQADNWQRNHGHAADMCDIVQVAKLHSYMRNKDPMPVPAINRVSAFHKLPLGELTPELTIQILEQSKDQINEARRLLSG